MHRHAATKAQSCAAQDGMLELADAVQHAVQGADHDANLAERVLLQGGPLDGPAADGRVLREIRGDAPLRLLDLVAVAVHDAGVLQGAEAVARLVHEDVQQGPHGAHLASHRLEKRGAARRRHDRVHRSVLPPAVLEVLRHAVLHGREAVADLVGCADRLGERAAKPCRAPVPRLRGGLDAHGLRVGDGVVHLPLVEADVLHGGVEVHREGALQEADGLGERSVGETRGAARGEDDVEEEDETSGAHRGADLVVAGPLVQAVRAATAHHHLAAPEGGEQATQVRVLRGVIEDEQRRGRVHVQGGGQCEDGPSLARVEDRVHHLPDDRAEHDALDTTEILHHGGADELREQDGHGACDAGVVAVEELREPQVADEEAGEDGGGGPQRPVEVLSIAEHRPVEQ
mmetsp:Transcript_68006/g.190456  ORF Transcript_68006/g.190456 Transcript_68006/m.190456 type:complete len:401 (+) Transcript_68006:391-1593(+)